MSGLETDLQEELGLSFEAYHEHMMGTWDIGSALQMIFVGLGSIPLGYAIGDYMVFLFAPLLILWGLVQAGQYRATINGERLIYEKR